MYSVKRLIYDKYSAIINEYLAYLFTFEAPNQSIMRAVIIDDEPKARKNIIRIVSLIDSDIQIVGEAESVKTGYQAILRTKPDLVFLDIQMPDGTGFDLLDRLPNINFKVIFITAFDNFAIKAFKYSAVDYLLKPINPEEFKMAVDKMLQIYNKEDYNLKINTLLSNISTSENQKLVLKTSEGYYVITISNIIRLESDKGYTNFIFKDRKSILVSNIIKNYDEMFSDKGFLRTHQSHLININYIESFIRADGGYIVMKNGDTVPVSKRKKETIIQMLDKMS